jgi:hypothetical protein
MSDSANVHLNQLFVSLRVFPLLCCSLALVCMIGRLVSSRCPVVDEANCTAWVLAVRNARHWFETITDDHPTRKLTGGVGGGEDDGPMIEQNQNPLGQGQQVKSAVAVDSGEKKKKKKKKKKAKKDSDSDEDDDNDAPKSQRGRGRAGPQKSASLRSLLQSGVAPQEYV